MNRPILVIMAAGIGSRFGGLKQLAPVGLSGEPIIKFSLYDAIEAGFEKVVFIIKKEIDKDFRNLIGRNLATSTGSAEVEFVYQELNMIPKGYSLPKERVKPWGTAHAILCAKEAIDGPFAVINADDYYGKDAFKVIFNYLLTQKDQPDMLDFSMVGYFIENTLTENGHVTRGVCRTKDGFLTGVDERFRIEKHGDAIEYTEDEGKTWSKIDPGTIVSMNMWGFSKGMIAMLDKGFPKFLDGALDTNPLKEEYLLPKVVNELLWENKARVRILNSKDKWYGVTYKEDLGDVAQAIKSIQASGLYPEKLF